jgi:HAD superfamily hydrolase (TIGR01509 family)
MSVAIVTSRVVETGARAELRNASRRADTIELSAYPPREPFELDSISSRWQVALDAAQRALEAAAGSLPPSDLGQRRRELVRERQQTAEMLARLARSTGVRSVPWLAPVPVSTKMLGLPGTVTACLFDLDGVLTDSAALHASAWGEVFDELLSRLSEKTRRPFVPFDPNADYRAYLDGRPRIEGVHAFLASRGIGLPEGRFVDPAGVDTAWGLANRKGDAVARGLRRRGVTALPGARRYLEAAGHAGIKRAVVSASTSTLPMLELAGLATLIEQHVDADVIRAEGLRSRPAPDPLLAACRRLDARPEEAVTFTNSPAGVAAGNAAGLHVVGVGDGAQRELLQGFGAEQVVPALHVLLDPALTHAA